MTVLFENVLRMSVEASILILLVLLLRKPLQQNAPAWAGFVWLPVLFRLLCPWGLPILSEAVSPADLVVYSLTTAGESAEMFEFPGEATMLTRPAFEILPWLAWIWAAGMIFAALRLVYQHVRLRRLLADAQPVSERIYVCAEIPVPFELGIFRPRIYLPAGLTASQSEVIISHEKTHVRRGDGLVRWLFCAARAIHWFNPLVSLADRLNREDTEIACDEMTLRGASMERCAEYATCLLNFAKDPKCHLKTAAAFGGGSTKHRIERIMRRTARPWAAVLSVATCFLLSACALVLPVHQTSDLKLDYETTTTVHEDAGLTAAEFERYLSEYEQFDVTYRFGTFYYGDKPIREFIDGVVSKSSNGSRAVVARLVLNRPNGEVDVYTERTYDSAAGTFGPITGMHVQAVPNLIQTAWEAADIAPNAEEISVAQTTETIDAVLNS